MSLSEHRSSSDIGKKRGGYSTWIAVLYFSIALLLSAGLMRSIEPIWEPPDKWTYDWRTALLSPRAAQARSDIALVLIDETTIARYPVRSPIDRNLLAGLVSELSKAKPRAIGLDVIFERGTLGDADANLATAVRNAQVPIVLGKIDRRTPSLLPENIAFQAAYIKQMRRPAGHLYFSREPEKLTIGDTVIRFHAGVPPDIRGGRSFAELLSGKKFEPPATSTNHIAWLLPPNSAGEDLFPTIRVGKHDPGSSIGDVLPPGWESIVSGRIVLIGGEFTDRDRHLTPLSVVDGYRYPGVWVHAQILAQLQDGRYLRGLSRLAELALVLAVASIAFVVSYSLRGRRLERVVAIWGFLFLFAVGPLLFAFEQVVVPTAGLFLSWAIGGTFGYWASSVSSDKADTSW